jgi:CheY-like chemotaxis protein
LQIYDNVQVSADSLLYDSQSKGDVKMATAPRLTLQIFTGFSDRTWCLIFTQADGQLNYGRVYGVLSGGTIISILLFGLIISLLNTRYRTQQLAEQLTVDIRESEESYRNQFVNNSAAMLLIGPADGAIIDANVEAIGFYGYPFDIAVIDMRMPDMDGETLGSVIREDKRLAGTRMILLTSVGTRGDALRFQQIGFSAYTTKPIQHQELKAVLSMAIAEHEGIEPKPIYTSHGP